MSFETYLQEATKQDSDRTLPGVVVLAADRNGKFLFNDHVFDNMLISHP